MSMVRTDPSPVPLPGVPGRARSFSGLAARKRFL